MSTSDLALLQERFEYLTERESSDHAALNCPADKLVELCTALRDEFGYDMLVDVTAIDWDAASPRFTGIYHFLSTAKHEYLRVAADCTGDIQCRQIVLQFCDSLRVLLNADPNIR